MKNIFYTLWAIWLSIAILYIWKVFLIPVVLSVFFWLIMSYQTHQLKKKISHKASIYSIIFGYIFVLALCMYGIGSSAWYVRENISSLTSQIQEGYNVYEQKVKSTAFVSSEDISSWKQQGKDFLSLDMLGGIATWTLTGITTWMLILVLSFLMLLYEERIVYTIKSAYGKEGVEIIHIARKTVAQYCYGLWILILILFVLNTVWLLVFGVPYAFLIAAISAIATLVPTIWTLIGGVFATFVWGFLTGSVWIWFFIMAWYLIIQQIEEFFIMPKVVWNRVSLNTLTSIVSLFARWLLWGVAWLFLAIPIMGVIQKIWEKYKKPHAILMWNGKLVG